MIDREKVIDRNYVIAALEEQIHLAEYVDESYAECIPVSLLRDALALLTEQEWIPATNPPKETGRYLVTIMAGEYISAEAKFLAWSGIWVDPVEEYEHYNHVVAWMPMPEPYKPKEEDNA